MLKSLAARIVFAAKETIPRNSRPDLQHHSGYCRNIR